MCAWIVCVCGEGSCVHGVCVCGGVCVGACSVNVCLDLATRIVLMYLFVPHRVSKATQFSWQVSILALQKFKSD